MYRGNSTSLGVLLPVASTRTRDRAGSEIARNTAVLGREYGQFPPHAHRSRSGYGLWGLRANLRKVEAVGIGRFCPASRSRLLCVFDCESRTSNPCEVLSRCECLLRSAPDTLPHTTNLNYSSTTSPLPSKPDVHSRIGYPPWFLPLRNRRCNSRFLRGRGIYMKGVRISFLLT